MNSRLILLLTYFLGCSIIVLPSPSRADYSDAVIAYEQGNFNRAHKEFLTLAESGHASAEFMLGAMYFYGKGVSQNDAIAAIWFYKAAIKGNPSGQLAFGSLHIRGLGVRQNLVKAYSWLTIAAKFAVPRLQQNALALRGETARLMEPKEIKIAQKRANNFKAKPSGLILN